MIENMPPQLVTCGFVADAERLPNGHLRIGTRMCYPDGAGIDVFLTANNDALTDFGYTWSWLQNFGIDLGGTMRQKEYLALIESTHGTALRGQALEKSGAPSDDLIGDVLSLAQACASAADFMYIKRPRTLQTFGAKVADIIGTVACFEEDVRIPLKNGTHTTVSFLVENPNNGNKIAVQTLSGKSKASIKTRAEHIFVSFHDLRLLSEHADYGALTIYDEHCRVEIADLQRLEPYCPVAEFKRLSLN